MAVCTQTVNCRRRTFWVPPLLYGAVHGARVGEGGDLLKRGARRGRSHQDPGALDGQVRPLVQLAWWRSSLPTRP
eukprot:9825835-Lingulodinium_polyedra.AAC.1